MDPLSQGVVGATLPHALLKKSKYEKWGFLFAFLGGMAPDLDVLMTSQTDSLLGLEFHRQFTHSLAFIPLGGLLCALFFHFAFRNRMPFKLNYIYTTVGYATHGLLDACTSYGTQLFWPFSNTRVSWNSVSIVDPLFTLPLLVLTLYSLYTKRKWVGRLALIFGLSYLFFGVYQRDRALSLGQKIAKSRGLAKEDVLRMVAKPSLGNLVLWKIICETKDQFYIDAVRVGWRPKIIPGTTLNKLEIKRDFPWVRETSQHAIDIDRFRWFSNDYLAKSPNRENFIIDVRYSIVPNQATGLWGIQLFESKQDKHVSFEPARERTSELTNEFFKMLFSP